MHRFGHEVLARAGFTGYEDSGVGLGDHGQDPEQLFHAAASADDRLVSICPWDSLASVPKTAQVLDGFQETQKAAVRVRQGDRTQANGQLFAVLADDIAFGHGAFPRISGLCGGALLEAKVAPQNESTGNSPRFVSVVAGQGLVSQVGGKDSTACIEQGDSDGNAVKNGIQFHRAVEQSADLGRSGIRQDGF